MKRYLLAAVAAAVLIGAVAPEATAGVRQRVRVEREMETDCQFDWINPSERWTAFEESLTARCVVARWPVEGGFSKLWCVGAHESGWNRFARSPYGHVGIFQHVGSAWPGRFDTYRPDGWSNLLRPWKNSRTMIVISVRMQRAQGWGPWTTAGGC